MFVWVFTKALQTCQMAVKSRGKQFPQKLIARRQVYKENPEHKSSSECRRLLHMQATAQGPLWSHGINITLFSYYENVRLHEKRV